ncbi:MAG: hypothetical protein EA341_01165 [Mongoliibacter sp.]|nr:MAG: hypothetical protein EA341_01165 [Mongoliibacter sp.]
MIKTICKLAIRPVTNLEWVLIQPDINRYWIPKSRNKLFIDIGLKSLIYSMVRILLERKRTIT